MIVRLNYIKDIVGNNYVGVNIYSDMLTTFLERFKEYVGDEYEEYVRYQQERDMGHYHATIFSVAEYNKIISSDIKNVEIIHELMSNYEVDDFKMLGIGSAQKNNNKAYFIVCQSEKIQEIRKRFELEPKDLHITIGFKWKDVHGVPKNIILKDKELFIDELAKYFFASGNSFNFIKELENYDFDITKDIYCTKIIPTYAEFRVSDEHGINDYFTISLLDNKLYIVCKWQSSDNIPYLSHTIILRKFGQNSI